MYWCHKGKGSHHAHSHDSSWLFILSMFFYTCGYDFLNILSVLLKIIKNNGVKPDYLVKE